MNSFSISSWLILIFEKKRIKSTGKVTAEFEEVDLRFGQIRIPTWYDLYLVYNLPNYKHSLILAWSFSSHSAHGQPQSNHDAFNSLFSFHNFNFLPATEQIPRQQETYNCSTRQSLQAKPNTYISSTHIIHPTKGLLHGMQRMSSHFQPRCKCTSRTRASRWDTHTIWLEDGWKADHWLSRPRREADGHVRWHMQNISTTCCIFRMFQVSLRKSTGHNYIIEETNIQSVQRV